ncbi:MAG: hypothetical protein GY938_31700, partial [Ketobacter sp.]|nr:hypothetical protein [Ketobacter sp.]
DDTAPSSRSQLDQLSVTGAAVNVGANAAPNGFVMTTGTETTNDEDATQSLDGTRHVLDESGTTLDCYYKFNIGGDGLPTSVTFTGVFNGGNDDFDIYANAGTDASPTWQQIGTLAGTNSSANVTHTFTMLVGQVVSDVVGEVQVRVYSTALTGSSFDVDQVFVSKSVVNQSVGYSNGSIWVNTNLSNTNTENYIDGTADNPVSTWAAAKTLNTQLGLNRFNIAAGSSITLDTSCTNCYFQGQAYNLALGGQDIDGAYFFGANVTGIGTAGSANHPVFEDCPIGTVSLPPSIMRRCFLSGTITNTVAGDWFINHCMSRVAGSGSPTFDFGTSIGNTNLNMRLYSGGIQLESMGDTGTDLASIEGFGNIIEGTCAGGSVTVRGMFTTSGITNITLSDDARFAAPDLVDDIWDEDIVAAHTTADTAGDKLESAGGAADPWSTALPGAYGAGTAGKLIGDNIDAPISTVDTVVDTINTNVSALNNVAATDIVSAGAITTLSGAVVNVDTVDTTTTNTDMRGTDSAATAAVCTETRLSELDAATGGKMANQVDVIQTDTTTDIPALIAALNDLTAAQVNAECDTAIADAALATGANLATVDTVVDAIKVITDQMVFTKANELDVNTKSINDAEVVGDGNATPWDGA